MRLGVVALEVVRVVRRHDGDAGLLREPEELRHQLPLDREAVVHQLDEVAVPPEEFLVPESRLFRSGIVARQEPLGDLGLDAPRERDDPLVVFLEELPVHPGLVVEAGQERL